MTSDPEFKLIEYRPAFVGSVDLGYTERWVCDPPSGTASYRVIRDEWSDDSVRTIYEVQVIGMAAPRMAPDPLDVFSVARSLARIVRRENPSYKTLPEIVDVDDPAATDDDLAALQRVLPWL